MRIQDFDVVSYLQSRNIPYASSGDNVSSGWIGINCLFCIDHSDHLGINLHTKAFNCYKCGETGSALKLVKAVEGISSTAEAFRVMEQFVGGAFVPRERHYQSKVIFPIGSSKNFPMMHSEFLRGRGYDPKEVIKKYDLLACGPIGQFKHRIIIPIFANKRIQSFVGRDVTRKSSSPYVNSSENVSVKDAKHCLYNIDNVLGSAVIVVEGIFDAWRIGDGAVATFGTRYTHEQLLLLRGMKRVFIMFDSDAIPLAYKMAHDLSSLVKNIEVLELDEGDPDKMSESEVKSLRKDIGL
jgi:hypothetical protein